MNRNAYISIHWYSDKLQDRSVSAGLKNKNPELLTQIQSFKMMFYILLSSAFDCRNHLSYFCIVVLNKILAYISIHINIHLYTSIWVCVSVFKNIFIVPKILFLVILQ